MLLKTEEFNKIFHSIIMILRDKNYLGRGVFILWQNITVLQVLRGGVWPIYYSILHGGGGGVSEKPQKVLRNICTAPIMFNIPIVRSVKPGLLFDLWVHCAIWRKRFCTFDVVTLLAHRTEYALEIGGLGQKIYLCYLFTKTPKQPFADFAISRSLEASSFQFMTRS